MPHRIYLDSDDAIPGSTTIQPFRRRQVASISRPETVKQIRQKVLRAVNAKDFTRAIAILNRLIAHHSATADDYNNRGLVYLWSEQPYKALRDFNQAIALNPDLPAAYNNRANYYAAQGAKESAIADYDRTIDLNPFHIRARINRAVTLRELGRYDVALDSLEEALLFRQMTGEVYAERGRTYHLRGDWNCAVSDYRHALTFFPEVGAKNVQSAAHRRQQITLWLTHLETIAS